MVARFVSRFCSALSPSSRMAAATSPLRRGDVERWWVGSRAPPPRAPTFVAQCRSPRRPLEGHFVRPRARSGSVPRSEHIARVRIDGLPRETCDAHQRIYHDIEHRRKPSNSRAGGAWAPHRGAGRLRRGDGSLRRGPHLRAARGSRTGGQRACARAGSRPARASRRD